MIHRNNALPVCLLTLTLFGLVREAHADEPAPLMRESAWADRTAELVFRENFTDRRATELEMTPREPEVVHSAGRVSDVGHDGGPAYMIDFDLPVRERQDFRLPVPESDSTGIHYRFYLKVDVDPEPKPGSLYLRINQANTSLHSIYHSRPPAQSCCPSCSLTSARSNQPSRVAGAKAAFGRPPVYASPQTTAGFSSGRNVICFKTRCERALLSHAQANS